MKSGHSTVTPHPMNPSRPSLDPPLRKLARAEHHLRTLERAIQEFLDEDPYSVSLEFYVDRDLTQPLGSRLPMGGLAYLALLFRERQPIPMWWAPLISDFLHNLRSALDHLVRQLVGPDSRPDVVFPIFEDEDRFERWRELRGLDGLDEYALAIIRAFQPFQRSSRTRALHPLWMLRCLQDLDRLRVLELCGHLEFDSRVDEVRIHRCRLGPPDRIRVGPMKHGLPLVRFLVRFPRARELQHDSDPFQVKPHVRIASPFNVALEPGGPGTGRPVLSTLREILSQVRDLILPGFRQFYR